MAVSRCSSFGMRIRNRNPMNLEKMRIAAKPIGFELEKESIVYWNRLFLNIRKDHTTAVVKHWTGRLVCKASTTEWAIRKHLFNYTDATALNLIGKIIGERCLETGIHEVNMQLKEDDLKKERMKMFVDAIKASGLVMSEPEPYEQFNPFRQLGTVVTSPKVNFKPWEVVDE